MTSFPDAIETVVIMASANEIAVEESAKEWSQAGA